MKNKFNSLSLILFLTISFSLCAKFYSQDGQDSFIYNSFFKNKIGPGIFVDIGAHDGLTYSNTYFFEKELGWTGICIEPLPEIFNKLTKNRTCICINGCISNTNGLAQFLSIQGYSEMLSGLIDNYHPKHLDRIENELTQHGGKKEVITTQCYRLKDLLEKYNITHIDYLSIDTEGSELDILKSIDFSLMDIDIISVENNYNDPNFNKYLSSHHYKLVKKIGGDEIYQKADY